MKSRSPVLGYNHNVRYAGRPWHVQTEDSGVQNPHIFTHCFADGTILATKKTDYDAASEVVVVQKLMQTQHKQMLRDLKAGVFDDKIERIFGPIVREPSDAEAAPAEPAQEAPPAATTSSSEDNRATIPNLGPLLEQVGRTTPAPPTTPSRPAPAPPPTAAKPAARPTARLTPARPAVAVTARTNPSPPPTIGGRSAPPAPRSAPPTIGSGRSGVPQTTRPTAEGVVVARPTVIVGSTQKKGEVADFWKTTERKPDPAFGGDLISEKSLDEVILAYLSEDAPKK